MLRVILCPAVNVDCASKEIPRYNFAGASSFPCCNSRQNVTANVAVSLELEVRIGFVTAEEYRTVQKGGNVCAIYLFIQVADYVVYGQFAGAAQSVTRKGFQCCGSGSCVQRDR